MCFLVIFFLEKGVRIPGLCIERCTQPSAIIETTPYKRNTKINPKRTTKLATSRYTYNTDEGGDNTPTHIIKKLKATPSRPIATRRHNQSSRPSAAPMHLLQKSPPPSSSDPSSSSGKNQSIILDRHVVDVATTPDNISDLRVTIIIRPAPRLRYAASPRLAVDDVIDASTRHLSLPVPTSSCSKTMPPGGRTTLKEPSSSDPGDPDLGFPPEHPELGDVTCNDNASRRERRRRRRHRPPRPQPAQFSPEAVSPKTRRWMDPRESPP